MRSSYNQEQNETGLLFCGNLYKSFSQSLLDIFSAEPFMLIMEYVSVGTLRTFLQTNRVHLSGDPELQSLLTIASYHIALAMQHLRSKMVHTDLQPSGLENAKIQEYKIEIEKECAN